MGNSNDYNEQKRRVPTLQHIRTYEHPWMGTVTETLQPHHQTRHLMRVRTCMDDASHRQQLTKLRARKIKNSKYLLNLSHYEDVEEEELCATVYRLYVLCDYFESDLAMHFSERLKGKRHFEQDELLGMLANITRCLIYIQDNGLKNCFLTKQSIVYVGGRYLVLDTGMASRQHPYYSYLMGEMLPEDVFLAPEIIEQMRFCVSDPYISPKSDVYSLGVLMLHLACLQPMATYFDYAALQIDQESLLLKIDKIRYSEQFKLILKGMMEADEEERFGLITLQETLSLASKRDTFRGSRSTSLAELLRLNHNKSDATMSHRNSSRTYSHVEPKRKQQNKENHSPMKQLPLLEPIADVDDRRLEASDKNEALETCRSKQQETSRSKQPDTSRSKQTTVINQTVSSNGKHQHFRFDRIIEEYQSQKEESMNLSKHYRTTQSYNNSPVKAAFDNDSALKQESGDKRFGRLSFEDDRYYEGEIKEGRAEGNGVLFFQGGKIEYSGNWSNGAYQGFGTLYNKSPQPLNAQFSYKDLALLGPYWHKYEGQFFDGQREGFGTIYLTNSEKFSGCFKRDQADGYGSFYKKGGQVVNGIWADNKLRY